MQVLILMIISTRFYWSRCWLCLGCRRDSPPWWYLAFGIIKEWCRRTEAFSCNFLTLSGNLCLVFCNILQLATENIFMSQRTWIFQIAGYKLMMKLDTNSTISCMYFSYWHEANTWTCSLQVWSCMLVCMDSILHILQAAECTSSTSSKSSWYLTLTQALTPWIAHAICSVTWGSITNILLLKSLASACYAIRWEYNHASCLNVGQAKANPNKHFLRQDCALLQKSC